LQNDSIGRVELLTLWDNDVAPSAAQGLVYCWNGYAEQDNVRSLFAYVEQHDDRLRRKYLDWVRDAGECEVDGKRIIDHLQLEDGLSYWWLTPLFEKSIWKSPQITDVVRLFAFEEILGELKPSALRLVSPNERLHEVIAHLCGELNLDYRWDRVAGTSSSASFRRRFFRALPEPLQGLLSFARHVSTRWRLRPPTNAGFHDDAVLVTSYFIGVDKQAAEAGLFQSHFWGRIGEVLKRRGIRSNWLHIFISEGMAPAAQDAVDYLGRFNQRSNEQGFHGLVDGFISARVVARTLKRWLILLLISFRLSRVHQAFRPRGSSLSLWPLFQKEWHRSTRGAVALNELLWLELFDEALRRAPGQAHGFYLFENQAWERAFLHAWRKHEHGRVTAVIHSTVRFWDLRYFSEFAPGQNNACPAPDAIAVNGRAALEAFHRAKVSMPLVEGEALRYEYVKDVIASRPRTRSRNEPIRLLILGDYFSESTIKLMRLLEQALPLVRKRIACVVKPHPNFPVRSEDYPSLGLDIIDEPLAKVLSQFDVAYCGNQTTAAIDAYLAGLDVVVMLNDEEFNSSPVRGYSDVRFVSTPSQLAEALVERNENAATNVDSSDFFFIDPELPRWQRLLTERS
jgi:surface carbohydrate biosynthesis protein (TIGR04326 family)